MEKKLQLGKNSNLIQALGAAVRYVRKSKGISRFQMAWRLDCHVSRITTIETGLYAPTLTNLVKTANALRVRPSALLLLAEELHAQRRKK